MWEWTGLSLAAVSQGAGLGWAGLPNDHQESLRWGRKGPGLSKHPQKHFLEIQKLSHNFVKKTHKTTKNPKIKQNKS